MEILKLKKLFLAIFLNSFLYFLGFAFAISILLIRSDDSRAYSGGWIGFGISFSTREKIYIAIIVAIMACIPAGLINGFILGAVKNSFLTAVLIAIGYSVVFSGLRLYLSYPDSDNYSYRMHPAAIFFGVCLTFNIATFCILKWRFPDTPGFVEIV